MTTAHFSDGTTATVWPIDSPLTYDEFLAETEQEDTAEAEAEYFEYRAAEHAEY